MDINTKVRLNNDLEMPIFGFGTFKVMSAEPVLLALEEGYRLLDTATVYKNEETVGEAIQKSEIAREDIFVTTKLGHQDMDDPRKALEESLRKLKLEYVDLWLIHWPETGKRESAWKVMEKLYKEGKCKAIGVSNFTIKHLKELLEAAEVVPAINQVEFHVYLYQKELLDFCRSKGIVLESYMSLTRGRAGFDNPRMKAVAEKHSKTVAQVMLRWVLQHGLVIIPKSEHEERIRENADIFDFSISEEDMETLNTLDKDKHYCSWDPTNTQ